jgi:hypothetical protein
MRIFQSIASGLLGKAAFEGGVGTAVLGLILHVFIASSIVTTFYLVSRRFPGAGPATLSVWAALRPAGLSHHDPDRAAALGGGAAAPFPSCHHQWCA